MTIDGDWLAFAGSLIGAAAAVAGAVWVEHYRRGLDAWTYRRLLLDAFAAFEAHLDELDRQYARWRQGDPDLAGSKKSILDLLAQLEEADELLDEASRSVVSGNYNQRRTLYRLGKVLARNEETFRSEAEAVGVMRITEAVLKVHYDKVRPAAQDVRRALDEARSAWQAGGGRRR